MAILDYEAQIWRDALDLPMGSEPIALVLEGTWWRSTATEKRLAKLSNVRELAFPDMFIGEFNGCSIAYCCAYGAARAVEPAHIFAHLGTPLLIQIGTCGTLDVNIGTGTVVLPETCVADDGVSHLYGAGKSVSTSLEKVNSAERYLHTIGKKQGIKTKRTHHLTWPSLFAQSNEMCQKWARDGLQSVDMETSTVVAVARHFDVSAVSMLSVWDALPNGRTFMDPLNDVESARLAKANETVFDVALLLAQEARSLSNTI